MRLADIFPEAAVPSGVVDWKQMKVQVLSGLDIIEEYRSMGLRFADGPHNGKVQAHAMGREDTNPSAFVNLKTGVYHAHGDPPETLSFWDFAMRYGRFGEWTEMLRHFAKKAGVAYPKCYKTPKGWIEEARYPYRDRDGDVVFEVIRYRQANGKKTFRQRRPNGNGGWEWDLAGIERVLYRLPELLARPDETVFLVEGEKDVDTLFDLGLLATTSPQGAESAGQKYWNQGLYAPDLTGRHVVVLPDNDPPGRSFARLVAGLLLPTAASVKVIDLPDQAPKADVSDWIEQGHAAAELQTLAEEAPRFDPAATVEPEVDPDRDATAADLIAANAGTRWLWEGWLPLGVLTLLTAEPSTGKTRLGLDLTKRIANLSQWPDGQPIVLPDGLTNRVLWIAADHQHAELSDAPGVFGFDPQCLFINATVADIYGGTELQTPEQLADFEARINRIKPALVLIDTVTNTSDYKSQDTSDAKRQYKPLQEIAKRSGCSMVCVTHTNVAGKTLGRRADEKTRVTIRMECPDPEGQPNRRKLSVALSRLSVYPPPLGVTMHDAGNDYDLNPPSEPGTPGAEQGAKMPSPTVQEAMGFLTARLAAGPTKVHVLRTEAENRDPPISVRALYDARRRIDLEEYEEQGKKWWRLTTNAAPNEDDSDTQPF